jgi:hypothetical protein
LRRLAAIFGCTVALTAAMPANADDLVGDWLFDTSKFNGSGDCQISGRIRFTETPVKNIYSCKFESEQICGVQNGVTLMRVQQSCTAQKIGRQVAIKTKVDKILEIRPKEFSYVGYLADNFILTLEKNLAEMNGQHYDEQRQLKARFWRDIELVS